MKQFTAIAILDKNGKEKSALDFALNPASFEGGSFYASPCEWITMTGKEKIRTPDSRISNARHKEYIIEVEE